MDDREKRHKRARIYTNLCYGCVGCFLIGFLLDNIDLMVWGGIIGSIFFFSAALVGDDHLYEDPYDGLD